MRTALLPLVALTCLALQSAAQKICNLLDYGAAGDGSVLDDDAMSRALSDCSAGGQIFVPSGLFLLSPFNLTSNMELYLDAGSVLLASTDFSAWPVVESLPSYPPDEVTT